MLRTVRQLEFGIHPTRSEDSNPVVKHSHETSPALVELIQLALPPAMMDARDMLNRLVVGQH